jgi:hypothetical protein
MVGYYLEVLNPPDILLGGGLPSERFWRVGDTSVKLLGVLGGPFDELRIGANQDGLAALKRQFPNSDFYTMLLSPGEYYPCMARPNSYRDDPSPGRNPDPDQDGLLGRARAISTGQLHALITQLQDICQTVHLDTPNFQTFGTNIRNLLILTCTEVEAQWKYVLAGNRYNDNGRPNTNDYVKLLPAMRLNEFEVALTWYPWLETFKPFSDWDPSRPTSSLDWYDAYNKVKHDRVTNFQEATILRLIYAVTGCFVMLCAQYGWDFARKGDRANWEFFKLIKGPSWQPSELYVPAFGLGFHPVDYQF